MAVVRLFLPILIYETKTSVSPLLNVTTLTEDDGGPRWKPQSCKN
jgi:hypothetical protein